MIYDSDDIGNIFILFSFDLLTYKNISLNSAHTPDALSQLRLCEGYSVLALFIPDYRQIVPTTQMHTPPMYKYTD